MLRLWTCPEAPAASPNPAGAKPTAHGRGDEDGLLNGPVLLGTAAVS